MKQDKKLEPSEVTVLVVDDDSQVREIVSEFLASFGYTNVIQAKDGKMAIKLIQNPSQKIDIIISDWEMPNIDGLTLLRAVRKDPHRNHIKFMMVSSQGSHERMKISKAAKSRVDAYIVKPFRKNILQEKMNLLINNKEDPQAKEFERAINGEPAGNTGDPNSGDQMRQLLERVRAELEAKNYEEAIRLCQVAADLFPSDADIYFYLGKIHDSMGRSDEALKYLKHATKLQTYHVGAHTLITDINSRRKSS
ncbi:MAG: response regulator [Oligoflexia bacterium]|nr:response regulator [Oligoflexia bacterium]